MLKNTFKKVYAKIKVQFYRDIFRRFQDREASLTTVELFSVETIHALGNPTVNEFATYMNISSPNAAYKVNSLIKKGYIQKTQSSEDRREYHLEVTEKYLSYYNVSSGYMDLVIKRIQERFSPEDYEKLSEMLEIICDELMAEVDVRELD